jgi:YcaO-like protein with predicted kinase domain
MLTEERRSDTLDDLLAGPISNQLAYARRALASVGPLGASIVEDLSPSWLPSVSVARLISARRFNEWGRGLAFDTAALGAFMERVERVSAYLGPDHIQTLRVVADNSSLPVLSLSDLGLCNFQKYLKWDADERSTANTYVRVTKVVDGSLHLAPASRVFLRHDLGRIDYSCSTGLAAHFTAEDAINNAILECLERHFHHLATFSRLIQFTEVVVDVDLNIDELLIRLKRRGFTVRIFHSDVMAPLHAFVVELIHPSDTTRLSKHSRYHCSIGWNAEIAIERTITEMIVRRCSAGWNPDSGTSSPRPIALSLPWSSSQRKPRALCDLRNETNRSLQELIKIANRLESNIFICDLTHPHIRLPVFRALMPGLQPNFDLLGYVPIDFRSRVTPHLDIFGSVTRDIECGNFM